MQPQPTPPPAPAAASPDPCPTYLPDEVGHLSLGFLLIDATRYNLSRPGAGAWGFAEALLRTLPRVQPHIRQQLVQDIELALRRDALTRGKLVGPLGTAAELAEWQAMVHLARQLDAAGT